MFACSDLVLAGVEDYALLFGSNGEAETLDWAGSGGAGEIVVKQIEPGCLVLGDGGPVAVPTAPVPVVDTTAAGDSFAAGYIAARERGAGPVDAAIAGHALAGQVVLYRGAIIPRNAMPANGVRA
jgi:2-dehydro-3-deoxygluconokinase